MMRRQSPFDVIMAMPNCVRCRLLSDEFSDEMPHRNLHRAAESKD